MFYCNYKALKFEATKFSESFLIMKIKNMFQVGGFILLFLFSRTTWSEEIRMYTDQIPSAEEMADIMFPEFSTGQNTIVKTRSVKFGTKIVPTEHVSIAMPINFDYDSTKIRMDSEPYLDQIGLMMNLEKLSDQKIIIEGHTDAAGSDAYNHYLSENRARSVREYLQSKYNIPADRLQINGKGETAILPGKDPSDPMNRRVQFYRAQ